MWEDLNAFFRKAAEEDQETPSGEEDLLDEKENVSDDPDSEDLQDIKFSPDGRFLCIWDTPLEV